MKEENEEGEGRAGGEGLQLRPAPASSCGGRGGTGSGGGGRPRITGRGERGRRYTSSLGKHAEVEGSLAAEHVKVVTLHLLEG